MIALGVVPTKHRERTWSPFFLKLFAYKLENLCVANC